MLRLLTSDSERRTHACRSNWLHAGPQDLSMSCTVSASGPMGRVHWISVWDHFYANPPSALILLEAVATMTILTSLTSRVRAAVWCSIPAHNPGLLAKR